LLFDSIMSPLSDSPIAIARQKYSSYLALPDELGRVLEAVRVRNVTAIYYICAPHYAMPPRRIGDDMFYFVVKGKGEVVVENRKTKVTAGDAVHFARGELHAAYADRRDPFDIIALHYDATVHESLTLPQLLHIPDVVRVGLDGAFYEMAGIACREYALRPPGWERGLEALFLRLLLHYVREHLPQGGVVEHARWSDLRRVLPALEWMRKNLQEAITVPQLAAQCHLSEPHFRRLFVRAMETTPNEYLRRLRLEEAALLLRRGDQTVDAVAAQVGYCDPSFFARAFKARMGASPGKYREQSAF
jgi:AraC-like DNA-binding protein/quercetin dioxygenase-like cupin family protein